MINALPVLNTGTSTFRDDSDLFFSEDLPQFSVELEDGRIEINDSRILAEQKAQVALNQVTLAQNEVALSTSQAQAAALSAASVGATVWVSGTTYAIGVSRYSPINSQVYRRLTAGAGTTDPSADTVNWSVVNSLPNQNIVLPVNNLPQVRPSLNLDFVNAQSVDPRIIFTRASIATRTNNKGLIEVVPAGAPRIDFDPVTGACRGLLIEEQRTNLLTYSEMFSESVWVKNNTTVTPNVIAAPDGTLTADSLTKSTTFASVFCNYTAVLSAHAGSFYVKAGTENVATILITESFSSTILSRGSVNLTTGVVTNITGLIYSVDCGGGWWRIWSTATFANANTRLHVCPGLYSGAETGSIFIWGAQLEAGAFPTSYIQTAASQVTRVADVASMTGANFSSWYRQDEGSFVAEVNQQSTATTFTGTVFSVSDGTNQETIELYRRASDATMRLSIADGGVSQAFANAGVTTVASLKTSISYKLNSCSITLNGAVPTTDTAATIPTVDRIYFGSIIGAGTSFTNGHLRSISYYPEALTSAELQALSRL